MAVWAYLQPDELYGKFVLSPERYDPRRESVVVGGVPVRRLVMFVRQTVSPSTSDESPCLVLDTTHAHEGVIRCPGVPVSRTSLGSMKKRIEANDIIISRLRPYLRQVAYVDSEIARWTGDVMLLCSTEFFVLRSLGENDVAFLVPFLLSESVQNILSASQEGGHHPRFDERTLGELIVPSEIIGARDELSAAIRESVRMFRHSEATIASCVSRISDMR